MAAVHRGLLGEAVTTRPLLASKRLCRGRSPADSRSARAVALTLIVISVAALAAGCSSRKTAANPLAPSVYFDHALGLMRANAIYTPASGWDAVTAEAHKMALGAKSPADTYGAILYVVGQLTQAGDAHAKFENPLTAKLKSQGGAALSGTTPTPPPSVSLVDRWVGYIEVPAISSLPTSPNSRRYVSDALSSVSSLQAKDHPCGWIIDLRTNTGGGMYPMLLSVGPILGEGRLIGFTGKSGFSGYVSYRDSTLFGDGKPVRAPLKVAVFSPAPPVAILVGPATMSSGEAVAIAFRWRPNTRSFGAPTGGVTNSPQTYRLADGATVRVSVEWDVDRRGTVYTHSIKPDVAVSEHLPDKAVVQAAEKWLLSTASCSQHHG